MRITKLDLYTNDLTAVTAFYQTRLYLPLLRHTSRQATLRVGWTELTFHQTEAPTAPCHFALNVPLYTLEQYQGWFDLPYIETGAQGQHITHFANWKARASYFRDPDGNIVEFIERRDAGYTESMGGYFQGISEIGVATSNVAHTTAQLTRQCGLPQFTKSKPMPDFNVVGDDYGLLILAQQGRPWLFTDVPATAGQGRVQFSEQQRSHTIEL